MRQVETWRFSPPLSPWLHSTEEWKNILTTKKSFLFKIIQILGIPLVNLCICFYTTDFLMRLKG